MYNFILKPSDMALVMQETDGSPLRFYYATGHSDLDGLATMPRVRTNGTIEPGIYDDPLQGFSIEAACDAHNNHNYYEEYWEGAPQSRRGRQSPQKANRASPKNPDLPF